MALISAHKYLLYGRTPSLPAFESVLIIRGRVAETPVCRMADQPHFFRGQLDGYSYLCNISI